MRRIVQFVCVCHLTHFEIRHHWPCTHFARSAPFISLTATKITVNLLVSICVCVCLCVPVYVCGCAVCVLLLLQYSLLTSSIHLPLLHRFNSADTAQEMRIPRLVSTLLRTSCTKWNLTTGTDHTAQRALLSGMSNALVRSEPLSSGNKSFLELDRALQQADKIVGNSASSNSLQHHLNEEVSVVTEILQRLVGTNHSLSAIEK